MIIKHVGEYWCDTLLFLFSICRDKYSSFNSVCSQDNNVCWCDFEAKHVLGKVQNKGVWCWLFSSFTVIVVTCQRPLKVGVLMRHFWTFLVSWYVLLREYYNIFNYLVLDSNVYPTLSKIQVVQDVASGRSSAAVWMLLCPHCALTPLLYQSL